MRPALGFNIMGDWTSPNYIEGERGWRISDDGNTEFNTGTFRGNIEKYVAGELRVQITEDSLYFYDSNGDQVTKIKADTLFGFIPHTIIETSSLEVYNNTNSQIVISTDVGGASSWATLRTSSANGYFYILPFADKTYHSGDFLPEGTTYDLWGATYYWNDINYKTLTDRGCLGSFDNGVEMPDGRIVSDIEALKLIKVRKDRKTPYGKPMLDYRTMPKAVFKPAATKDGKKYKRDKNDNPLPIKDKDKNGKERKVQPEDGAEMSALISIMIGAIKELDKKIEKLEKNEKRNH